jgi:hypothetical protein
MTLRTLIGGAASLALAVTGGMLGSALAAQPEPQQPWTVRTLVVPAQAEAGAGTSDLVESTARIGVTGAAMAANALAILEAASSAPDPQAAAEALVEGRVFDSADDPCVLTGQSPPGSCPTGLYGNAIVPAAPRIEQASVSPPGHCDMREGEVAIAVVTTLPAPVTVSWWAAAGPVRDRAVQAGATDCIPLDGLMPDTAYSVHVTAGDDWRRFTLDSAGRPVRPSAVVYAPTDDLIAVTVPHRPGETVDVYPNVLNGGERRCDETPFGYDLAVHRLGVVTGSVSGGVLEAASIDPSFTERTTVGYDVGEGLTVFLCVVVHTSDGVEVYSAQTIVETADRLVPELVVTSVTGRDLPGWELTAWLPSGQRCGSWRPDAPATNGEVDLEPDSASLCDTTDPVGPAGATIVDGRGVLPFSAGDRSSLVVDFDYPQVGPSYTALDLGPAAHCTGACQVPTRPAYFAVQGRLGQATLLARWTQGSSNGASTTSVAPVEDVTGVPLPGPLLDVAQSRLRLNAYDQDTRGITVALPIRADRPASYLARLVPAPGEPACERPGAVLELSGELSEQPFNAPTSLEFEGLCHGSEYQAIVELTDRDGHVTTWGAGQVLTAWGAASTISVPAVLTTATVSVLLSGDSAPSVYLTLRAGGLTVIGPRYGRCPGIGLGGGPSETVTLPIGETTRFSGVIELPNATPGASPLDPCIPFWGTGRAGIPFEFELSWEQLVGPTHGTSTQVLLVDQTVRGISGEATVVAMLTIVTS